MKPTREWMARNFSFFNAKYFNNKLKTPVFDPFYSKAGNLGFYTPNGTEKRGKIHINGPGTIHISNQHDRSEKDLQETLLHEMIHQYVLTVEGIYERGGHSRNFKTIANRINQDGWDISETGVVNKYTGEDQPDNNNQQNSNMTPSNPNPNTQNNTTPNAGQNTQGGTTVNNGGSDFKRYKGMPNRQDLIQATYLFVLVDPNETQYQVWGFRGEYEKAEEYARICSGFVKGKSFFRIYKCIAKEMVNFPMATDKLDGIGASGHKELFNKIATLIGVPLNQRNMVLVETIMIN
jgi:hypothetical protein